MITIESLHFAYRKAKNKTLFYNLDWRLTEGNVYGLLGKNGAGKTTLLKIIMGLLYPQSGSCKVLGNQSKERLPDMLQSVYFIPEELYVHNVTLESFIRLYAPFYPLFDTNLLNENLATFEISGKRKLNEFSYGQKKKILLSFGFATRTPILILDEPTNGLDIPSKRAFRKVLASSIEDYQTVIISTHQLREVSELVDPITILDEGKIVCNHSIEKISENLLFETKEKLTGDELYYEGALGRYTTISKNVQQLPSRVDLELLFSAVVENSDEVINWF